MLVKPDDRVLFLDIDGVLNHFLLDWSIENIFTLCPKAIEAYQAMIEEIKPYVVLSSTWRKFPDHRDHLRKKGIRFSDCTPILNGIRGLEINLWRTTVGHTGRYAILDDDSDFLPDQKPFHVKTQVNRGLQSEHIQRIKELLRP
jgi:hypothetical protein